MLTLQIHSTNGWTDVDWENFTCPYRCEKYGTHLFFKYSYINGYRILKNGGILISNWFKTK